MKKFQKLAEAGVIIGSILYAAPAMAQIPDVESNPIPVITQVGILGLLQRLVSVVLIIAGVIAVIYLIYGGIMYITAGGDAEKAGKGRVAITNAIIGIIIIAASYAIYAAVINGLGGTIE
ncbi:hypothetical protein COT77_01500 [Candidatus Berkelbacteria bacterium CG10_big_fil_rev_8_21_14_0_10_41_12]|uniref:DUF4190 domain-containing protein n=1 Tax=Candidatus Berkelbacteria bacterium CG10_big_fil_rev_8_21_14_0_10_41_12 TaxID=1974513 RepID=A0A2M6WXC7_9BACT|nr:MAG: hypothetical protein COT77_01500 [Candidatus Berkelbacteria bacterium CG10_big_fil_rev_8_21_14_0_10_41_12]